MDDPIIPETEARRKSQADSLNGQGLTVPDVAGLSLQEAALAYAKHGWYVLPTDPTDIKNPGSVVGGNWHEKSSRDPGQIRLWWTTNPNYGIALHCGRSGAVVFDLDVGSLDAVRIMGRDDIAEALLSAGAIHGTRRDGDRGHYIFAMPEDVDFGNGAGAFMICGEVRGKNGVIIAAPTPHPDAETKGGDYNQRKTGAVGPLPDVLRACLTEAGGSADPLTDDELDEFLDAHTGVGCGRDGCRHVVSGQATWFKAQVSQGASRHDKMTATMVWAMSEAMAGCYPAREAFGTLYSTYSAEFNADDDPARVSQLGDEYLRIAKWAAAAADPDRAHRNDELPTADQLQAFWTARPVLSDLRQFARARRVGPWAMFGHVLAIGLSAIPPDVVLPPIVGDYASLNLFVALVGRSGESKSAAMRAAMAWLRVDPEPNVRKPGSGEGLAKCFAYVQKPKGLPPQQVGKAWSVLAVIPEVDTLAATGGRGGSTLMSELRSAWSGERLGHDYAGVDKAITINDYRYRLCMTIGVQPVQAGPLFDDADAGTPQRIVWFSASDPDAPDERPVEPKLLELKRWPEDGTNPVVDRDVDRAQSLDKPADRDAFDVLGVPQIAWGMADDHARDKLRDPGSIDPLDGHKLLVRLRVAAGLMWLDSRTDEITDEDWELAGIVMAVSDGVRAGTKKMMATKAGETNKQRGHAEGVRAVEAEKVKRHANLRRVAENLYRVIERSGGGIARTKARNKIAQRDRDEYFDDAEALLLSEGRINKVEHEHNEQQGYYLRLTQGRANVI